MTAAVVLLAVVVGLATELALRAGGSEQAASDGAEVLLAAGDIAECDHQGDEATARILERYPTATIAPLGDLAYEEGSNADFENCYGPSWGEFKGRTRPATGNHDHSTTNAQGYWDYFGARGGPYDRYYYSYDLGGWHVVVLNSDCWRIGGCALEDPQIEWLRDDLDRNSSACTLAYWHRPPFSSGRYGDLKDAGRVRPLWQAAYEGGVDLVLTGHEHSYERFAAMDAAGRRDEGGVRLIVVGTGGGNLRRFANEPLPTTESRNDETWGVLKLTLRPTGYDWEFLPAEGATFTDSGSSSCR
ncbi:MAG TPA: metallophosphoesterase [Gaiellaceae bacterium]